MDPSIRLLLWMGLYFGGSRIANYQRGEASLNWPRTEAVVRELSVNNDQSSGKSDHLVAATYDYSIAGVRYTGHRVSFDYTRTRGLTPEDADKLMYQVKMKMRGDDLTIYYNPKDPGWSVIFPGHVPFQPGMLAPFISLLGCAVLFGFLATDRVERRWDELVVKFRMNQL